MYYIYQVDNKSNEEIINKVNSENEFADIINDYMNKNYHAYIAIKNMNADIIKTSKDILEGIYLLENNQCMQLVKKYKCVNSGYVYNSTYYDVNILFTWRLIKNTLPKEQCFFSDKCITKSNDFNPSEFNPEKIVKNPQNRGFYECETTDSSADSSDLDSNEQLDAETAFVEFMINKLQPSYQKYTVIKDISVDNISTSKDIMEGVYLLENDESIQLVKKYKCVAKEHICNSNYYEVDILFTIIRNSLFREPCLNECDSEVSSPKDS